VSAEKLPAVYEAFVGPEVGVPQDPGPGGFQPTSCILYIRSDDWIGPGIGDLSVALGILPR
jgi:hypothetical protein